MTRFVIDPPTLVAIAQEKRTIPVVHQLVAPNSLRSASLALLLDDVRRGKLSERDALESHRKMTEIKVRLLGDRVSRRTAWDIARDHEGVSIFDAEYLAVTVLQGDALISTNRSLTTLARGLVRVAKLTELFS